MSSVCSKGRYRAAVDFFRTRLLLLFRTCQFRLVDNRLLRLASYRCLSGATCGTSPALRFLRLCFGLDRSADCGCLGYCNSLASLSSLTALFFRYRLFWQIQGRNFLWSGRWLLLQPHQIFVHRYGYYVVSALREIVIFWISVRPFRPGFNSLELLGSRRQRILKLLLIADQHWLKYQAGLLLLVVKCLARTSIGLQLCWGLFDRFSFAVKLDSTD